MYRSQSWIEIDLNNLENNYLSIKSFTNTNIGAVLKANAYGMGALDVAKFLEKKDIKYFCVANFSEAMELIKNDIKKDILILGYVPEEVFKDCIKNNLELTVYDKESAKKLSQIAKEENKKANIHIKIDTGMNRLGFCVDSEKNLKNTIESIKKIKELKNINIKSIFSHFAESEAMDKTFTKIQYDKFKEVIKELEKENIDIKLKHISNDGGFIYHKYFLDMVRTGIGLFGYFPSSFLEKQNIIKLKPICSLFSTITHIHNVKAGEYISYNRTYKAQKDIKVATIAIGYADCYPVSLSNKGYVYINGKKANIVGKVCMDQLIVDISDIDAKKGDRALIYGIDKENDVHIKINELVEGLDTNVYEVLCRINMRIPRIYKYNNKVTKVLNYLIDEEDV